MLIIAGLIAIFLPLLFLYIIYALDLYSSGSFRTVALCFGWGLVAFGLSFATNTAVKTLLLEKGFDINPVLAFSWTVVWVAPVVEELIKSLALIYLGRRPDFTYFVDGAIYGFAAGIGFSILENFFYISQAASASQGPLLVVSRSFSTCLMHGSASALVGVAVGRFRYGRGRTRILSAILGWGAAIALHVTFNRVVTFWQGSALLIGSVGLGLAGVGLISLFIRWGLAEEKRWIDEKLGMDLRVTKGEKALVGELQDLEHLLAPIRERFGKEKANLVADFLLKQAQLGIKQKSSEMAGDPALKQQVEEQVAALRVEIDALRRQVGVYCMTYVRSIYPMDLMVEWAGNLERRIDKAREREPRMNLWGNLQSRAAERTGPREENDV